MIEFIQDCLKYLTKKEFRINFWVLFGNASLLISGIVFLAAGYSSGAYGFICLITGIPLFFSISDLVEARKKTAKTLEKSGKSWIEYKATLE